MQHPIHHPDLEKHFNFQKPEEFQDESFACPRVKRQTKSAPAVLITPTTCCSDISPLFRHQRQYHSFPDKIDKLFEDEYPSAEALSQDH